MARPGPCIIICVIGYATIERGKTSCMLEALGISGRAEDISSSAVECKRVGCCMIVGLVTQSSGNDAYARQR